MLHRAKKSLGQNFLKDRNAINKIVAAAQISPNDKIVEIGPGKGALTSQLLETGATIIAVEKDADLVDFLTIKFHDQVHSGQLQIISGDVLGDFLETGLETLGLVSGGFKVVANLPYYITGRFLSSALQATIQPSEMVLVLQKEVVDRVVAADGKQSILSIAVAVYGQASRILTIGRKSFAPVPAVDSAVLAVRQISKQRFIETGVGEEEFFVVVKQGFSNKRKMLHKNLRERFGVEEVDRAFVDVGLDSKIRAEVLGVDQWMGLAKKLVG